MSELITTTEAAKIWGCSPGTVIRRAERGNVPYTRDGGGFFVFNKADILAYDYKSECTGMNIKNPDFTMSLANPKQCEVEANRARLAERIKAAKVTKATYLRADGTQISWATWRKSPCKTRLTRVK